MPRAYKYTQDELEYIRKYVFMTDRERKVFNLFYFRGWSIYQIADKIGYSRPTVARDLAKIRDKANERLKNRRKNN